MMPPDEQQPNDNRWQWDDSQWGDSTQPPRNPIDVPDPDEPGGFSASLRRLLSWASRKS